MANDAGVMANTLYKKDLAAHKDWKKRCNQRRN